MSLAATLRARAGGDSAADTEIRPNAAFGGNEVAMRARLGKGLVRSMPSGPGTGVGDLVDLDEAW
jgi:hypothetical protein